MLRGPTLVSEERQLTLIPPNVNILTATRKDRNPIPKPEKKNGNIANKIINKNQKGPDDNSVDVPNNPPCPIKTKKKKKEKSKACTHKKE